MNLLKSLKLSVAVLLSVFLITGFSFANSDDSSKVSESHKIKGETSTIESDTNDEKTNVAREDLMRKEDTKINAPEDSLNKKSDYSSEKPDVLKKDKISVKAYKDTANTVDALSQELMNKINLSVDQTEEVREILHTYKSNTSKTEIDNKRIVEEKENANEKIFEILDKDQESDWENVKAEWWSVVNENIHSERM